MIEIQIKKQAQAIETASSTNCLRNQIPIKTIVA
jgi:hypothetical protein